ncbi:MAG: TorF family putative porin, partial [Rhodomicrobium sp.]
MKRYYMPAALALLVTGTLTAAADEAGGMKDKAAAATPDFDVAFGGWTATDYIFRGISQSDRWPSVSSYTELRYTIDKTVLYVGTSGESIDYPNHAAAEVDFYAGVRPTFDKLSLDFGYWYYWYPGGQLFNGEGPPGPNVNCTNRFKVPPLFPGNAGGCNIYESDLSFWEVYGKVAYAFDDTFTAGANVYYSPSWLNEGADGTYASITGKAVL